MERKSISQKGSFIYKIGRFGFDDISNVQNWKFEDVDGFISFQTMKIVSMFVVFQIVACLHTKFGNVEAVDRLQI